MNDDATHTWPAVLTKRDFVRRYQAGEFGNRAPTWPTFSEYWRSGYEGLIHIRNRNAAAATWYNVPRRYAKQRWRTAVRYFGAGGLYISAMAPTECTVFQGEVVEDENYLSLTYSTLPFTMREALAERSEYASGIIALELLRHYLCQHSYEWLQVLFDRYPGHVVEFSTYSVNWGTLPGYNTVTWEVRSGY